MTHILFPAFSECRGHPCERENYLDDLRRAPWKRDGGGGGRHRGNRWDYTATTRWDVTPTRQVS